MEDQKQTYEQKAKEALQKMLEDKLQTEQQLQNSQVSNMFYTWLCLNHRIIDPGWLWQRAPTFQGKVMTSLPLVTKMQKYHFLAAEQSPKQLSGNLCSFCEPPIKLLKTAHSRENILLFGSFKCNPFSSTIPSSHSLLRTYAGSNKPHTQPSRAWGLQRCFFWSCSFIWKWIFPKR